MNDKTTELHNTGKLHIGPKETTLQLSDGSTLKFLPSTIEVELDDGSVDNMEYIVDAYKCSIYGGV